MPRIDTGEGEVSVHGYPKVTQLQTNKYIHQASSRTTTLCYESFDHKSLISTPLAGCQSFVRSTDRPPFPFPSLSVQSAAPLSSPWEVRVDERMNR
jgi:hypothetical protein